MLPLLCLLLALLPVCTPLVDQGNYFFKTPPIRQPSGAICSHSFVKQDFVHNQKPTVRASQQICADFGKHRGPLASIGVQRNFSTIRLRDIALFFNIVSTNYNGHPSARAFRFFAIATEKTCLNVRFSAVRLGVGRFTYEKFEIEHMSSASSSTCDEDAVNNAVSSIVCVSDNCTFPPPPTPPPTTPNPMVIARSDGAGERSSVLATTKQCLRFLRHEVVPLDTYNEHRLWVIVAGVGCNLISMALLAALIHYCMKYRHLRRHYRMLAGPMSSLGPGSLAGTASPTPAVRHLGSTVSTGAQLLHLSPSGGTYPDYQYSSIARRKLKNQQQAQHRLLLNHNGGHLDDETLSYRSDHARLLMPGNGSTLCQRHNSGAVSPPRGWGPEAPSTPGSIRRHGSISAMSMTSSGYPRRNGALPAPPAHMLKQPGPNTPPPPPPPPDNGTIVY